ncbi:MAG: hypothetical protein ACJAT4_000102 [Granulosicoccus sp.]|jgi:hypothetical protein
MTAKKELAEWLETNQSIENESERKDFFKEIHKELATKNGDELKEGLLALKDAVSDLHTKVKIAKDKSEIKVYPSSNEEVELLKSLFQKMNIRFELS